MKITKFHVKRCEMVQLLSFSQSISFARCHSVGYVFLAYFVCCALHTDIVTSMGIVLNHNWLPLNVVLVFDRRRGKKRSRGEIIFNCISTLSCVCVLCECIAIGFRVPPFLRFIIIIFHHNRIHFTIFLLIVFYEFLKEIFILAPSLALVDIFRVFSHRPMLMLCMDVCVDG